MTTSSLSVTPPRRQAPGWTGVTWAALGLGAFTLLPWSRTGRGLLEGGASAVALLAERPALGVVLLALLAAGLASLAPARRARGAALIALGALGFAAALIELNVTHRAFDLGALGAMLALVTLAGVGLSDANAIPADRFVAASVVWAALFVVAFILYPLVTVLRASFGTDGFTLKHFQETLSSPGFFLLENEYTRVNEAVVALIAAAAGLAGGAALAWRAGARGARLVALAALGAVVLGAASATVTGFGALRNSVLLSVVVGFASTALGLAFALLGSRSRAPIAPYMTPLLVALGALIGAFATDSSGGRVPAAPAVTVGALAGLGLASLMWRARWTVSRLLSAFSILPIITPPFVIGFALIFLMGRQGAITKGVFGLDTDFFLGPVGVGIAQTLAFTPIAYLVLVGVVDGLDASLEEAAQTLGANRWHVLRTVIWPLLRPGLANAFLLGMIESLADFGNPFILGGSFLATEVFLAVEFTPNNAAVLGVVLLALSLGVFMLQRAWVGRASYVTVTGKPSGGRLTPLPAALEHALLAAFTLWVAFTAAVYGSVVYGAFVKLWGFDGRFTLEHILNLERGSLGIFLDTLRVSAISTIPAVIVGFVIAYLVTRQRFPGRSWLEAGSLLSFAVPGTVMGIGYILAFNSGPLYLTGTATILVLAFVFRNMPVAIRSSIAALRQIDPALEEASATLRATSAVTLWRIVVPLLRSALLSGVIFAFVRAVTAISQVIFLISPDNKLITTEILGMVERGQLGDAAALSALLVLTMAAVITALFALSRALGGRPAASVGGPS